MITNQASTTSISPSSGSPEPVQIINTDQLKPVNYDWGAIKWICDMHLTPNSQQSFGYACMLPGTTNPEHRHMTCQEIIYVLAGELTVHAHGERTVVRPGQTALIPQGVRHSVTNESWESVVYLASFSAVFRETIYKGQTGQMGAVEKLY
jgi:quercetin dioxygenase-like cupin family protein